MDNPRPLSREEVAELDGYGQLSGRAPMPARAAELWEREIIWGREDEPNPWGLLN